LDLQRAIFFVSIRQVIRVGKVIYFVGKNTSFGKQTDPFGKEYVGFKFYIGAKKIPRTKIIAEDDIMRAVFRQGKYSPSSSK
jgi:hypothetical protein